MKTRRILTLIIVLFAIFNLSAEKRYVSKTGSSTPPYTTWETAADSVMKAMRASEFGDTIVVGDGIFTEVVRFNPGVVLLGSGWENTWIQIPRDSTAGVIMENMCEIKNLKINGFGMKARVHRGIYSFRNDNQHRKFAVRDIMIANCYQAFGVASSSYSMIDTVSVSGCVIDSCVDGVYSASMNLQAFDNYITTSEKCVYFGTLSECNVYNNILVAAPYIPFGDSFNITFYAFNRPSRIHNNLIISLYESVTQYNSGSDLGPDTISNNVYMGKFGKVIRTYSNSNYRDAFNNHISGGKFYGFDGESPLRFNNFWNNTVNWRSTGSTPIDTVTNITRYPMFVNESKDFHLQMYSPLIDDGDTLVKDVDGTRSDIGMYGGPHGKSYAYLDLAPVEPRGIAAAITGDTIKLAWKRNHESDFKEYLVYGDTIPGITADSTRLTGRTADTNFTKIIPGFSGNYYMVLRSVDNQGNLSDESEEIRIVPVGVKGEGHEVVMDYLLFNNYPNPFNPETVIGYRLKSPGRVILTVYTITGEPVRVLQDREMPAGYHETKFRGDDLASGIYLYKIDVRSSEGVPVYTSVKKMMLVK